MAASAVNGGSKGGADASHATIKSSGRVPGRVVRQHPWSLHYLVLRIVALLLRSVVTPLQRLGFLLEPALPSTVQCDKISIPSREPHRRIRAHVYRPRRVLAGTKLPVHVNFHGSGFVLPSLGQDSFFCAQLAERFNAVVVDCDYRKGPEAPYPAGVEDAEDAAAWLASGPKTLPPLDLDLLTCSGFSAGGNIALVLALKLSPRRCAGLATLYPPTELHLPDDKYEYKVKVPPNPNFKYGVRLPRPLNLFFRKAYIVKGTDDNVKWLSPLNAEVEEFPKVRGSGLTFWDANIHGRSHALPPRVRGTGRPHLLRRRRQAARRGPAPDPQAARRQAPGRHLLPHRRRRPRLRQGAALRRGQGHARRGLRADVRRDPARAQGALSLPYSGGGMHLVSHFSIYE